MNDISQMNTTWDEICQTAMDSRSGEYGPTNELDTGSTMTGSPARSAGKKSRYLLCCAIAGYNTNL